jgi:KaiC/GvpD/RAD55 family RecA-like ATPase
MKMKLFVCHASEDKDTFVRSLASALRSAAIDVWYDEYSLKLGDSLAKSIDKGLTECDSGIVVLSPYFFSKNWPQKEYSALITGDKKLIPILHGITYDEVKQKSLLLTDPIGTNSSLLLPKLVEKIKGRLMEWSVPDLKIFAPTGIQQLDQILGGGIRRHSSIVIEGPKSIGKTTLGIQIQKAALERGEAALFISYSEEPLEIIHAFIRAGCSIEDFIKKGTFRILDNYSSIIGITEKETMDGLHEYAKGIIHADPHDVDKYKEKHDSVLNELEKTGKTSVNVIDSTNARYELFGGKHSDTKESDKYFRKFKARGSMQGIGIHIVQDVEHNANLLPLLGNLEHGVIRMRFENDEIIGQKRYLQVKGIDYADSRWHEFAITNNKINVF